MEKLKPETAWENLILTTIKLEVKHRDIIRKGTSFCYHYNHSQLGDTVALVTNRHMIEHGKEFTLTFNIIIIHLLILLFLISFYMLR